MSVTADKNTDTDIEPDKDVEETTDGVDESTDDVEKSADDVEDKVEADNEKSESAQQSDGDEPRERRRPRAALIATAVLLVAVLGGAGYVGWQWWQQLQVQHAEEAAQQAAVEYAAVLTSIDTAKVDENFTQVLDGATGEFKDMYSKSSTELRQLLIDNKASAHGVVLESAVQSATKDKVVVLLFVDQSVSNTQVPDPRIDRSRIKMTMEYVDGRWRASKVELP
ncbi:tetratricopeptide repeat protein [Mycobacterium sp. 48b]|uniref:tetratricopeptide repeat protein n=1 Tax=Mycobacterium sp. 48b TaxID=3400426 RepID=UPI003AAFCD20